MENKWYNLLKIIKIFCVIFAIAFFGYLAYDMFLGDDGTGFSLVVFAIFGLLIAGFTIFVVVYGVRAGKEYRKNLISTKPKHRFKYLDSFYYLKIVRNGDVEETASKEYIVYHVIQDLDSQKIYAIGETGTNVRFQKTFDNTKLLRIDDIDGVSTRKDWKEVNYGDNGSFWIDQELMDYYHNDGEKITINYFGKKDKIKVDQMFNRNQNYNISLLDKTIFITGYAQFDTK